MYSGMIGSKRPGWIFFEVMQEQGVIEIAPDGQTAKGRWYTPAFECRPFGGTRKQTWEFGVYDNVYVKENGRWLFSKMHFFLNFRTPYEDGWMVTPVVGQNGPDANVPPDAPPTQWHPYPEGYHFPLHFKHPITGK